MDTVLIILGILFYGYIIFVIIYAIASQGSRKRRSRANNRRKSMGINSQNEKDNSNVCSCCGNKILSHLDGCQNRLCMGYKKDPVRVNTYMIAQQEFDTKLRNYLENDNKINMEDLVEKHIINVDSIVPYKNLDVYRVIGVNEQEVHVQPKHLSYNTIKYSKKSFINTLCYIFRSNSRNIEFLVDRYRISFGESKNTTHIDFLVDFYSLIIDTKSRAEDFESLIRKWEKVPKGLILSHYFNDGQIKYIVEKIIIGVYDVSNVWEISMYNDVISLQSRLKYRFISSILDSIYEKSFDCLKNIDFSIDYKRFRLVKEGFIKFIYSNSKIGYTNRLFELMMKYIDPSRVFEEICSSFPLIIYFIENKKYYIAERMIKYCKNINVRVKEKNNATLLIIALSHKDIPFSMIKKLLEFEADPKMYYTFSMIYPFQIAEKNGREDLVDLLSEY